MIEVSKNRGEYADGRTTCQTRGALSILRFGPLQLRGVWPPSIQLAGPVSLRSIA